MKKKKNISQEDLDTWSRYTQNPTDIIDKEFSSKRYISTNHRFKYDLHGFTLNAANKKVEEIILTCVRRNFKEILLITGKGIHSNTENDIYSSKDLSKLRFSVPEYINSNPDLSNLVYSIATANNSDGGDGALIIKLKKL